MFIICMTDSKLDLFTMIEELSEYQLHKNFLISRPGYIEEGKKKQVEKTTKS